jgi:hypothetical protein
MKKLALLLALACLGCPLVVPAGSQARNLYFGINANTRAWGNPGEEQDVVAETGASWLREDFEWGVVEPADDEWEWADTDELFEDAAVRGMEILPILNSPPCWAVPEETDPEECWETWPVGNAEYAEFTAEAVKRYGPSGDFWDERPLLDGNLAPRYWEVWNEPYYLSFTNGEVDPARYASLFKAAAIAGDEANGGTDYLIESVVDATVDPEIDPKGWVHWAEEIVDAEPTIGNYIDGIAIHPYPENHDPTYEPENGTDASFRNTDINYERWQEEGINKPVWITEVGYSACDDGADDCVPGETQTDREEQKAEWLEDIFDELGDNSYSFVHAVFLYNFRQFGDASEPNSDKEEWFGIVDKEGKHLPAWTSFANGVEEFDGAPIPNSTITAYSVKGSTAKFSFDADDGTATFECKRDAGAWTSCASPKEYTGVTTGSHEFSVRASNSEATENIPADMGWARRAPGTVADDAGTGTRTWANVGNAKSSDGFYSVAEVPSGTTATAHYLKATNFGFTVPGGETIVGIQASIERSEAGGNTGEVTDSRIRIVKGGTIQAAGDHSAGAKWPSVDTIAHLGGQGDLWSNTWTTTDINNSGFGVAFSPQIKAIAGGAKKAQVDEIEVVVFWD